MRKNIPGLTPFTPAYTPDAIRIWNAASHQDYPINERFLSYNLIPTTGEVIEGRVAVYNGEAVGFVLACAVTNDLSMTLGWVSAIAVHPSLQRKGIGAELLIWAKDWLKEKGCKRIRIGGNLRPFLPGLPSPLPQHGQRQEGAGTLSFFNKRGYRSPAHQPYEYDIARNLSDYQPHYSKPTYADLTPLQPDDEHLLLEFLHREYPGRWEFEAREFVKNGGRASDFLLLRVNDEVHGFCRLTLS